MESARGAGGEAAAAPTSCGLPSPRALLCFWLPSHAGRQPRVELLAAVLQLPTQHRSFGCAATGFGCPATGKMALVTRNHIVIMMRTT